MGVATVDSFKLVLFFCKFCFKVSLFLVLNRLASASVFAMLVFVQVCAKRHSVGGLGMKWRSKSRINFQRRSILWPCFFAIVHPEKQANIETNNLRATFILLLGKAELKETNCLSWFKYDLKCVVSMPRNHRSKLMSSELYTESFVPTNINNTTPMLESLLN